MYSNDDQIIEVENEDGEQELLCDGCVETIISPPYYYCEECRYFLHLPCAELPHQLQHSSHPHPLILTSNPRYYIHLKCHDCNKYSNGFFFRCNFEGCNFNLDVKCAALPEVVAHENHNHPLFRKPLGISVCSGCRASLWNFEITYGCKYCKFCLHPRCLMLPEKTKHRFDNKHPLILRYPPHSYHPRPFDCYQCEQEINPNGWLYHCEECDLSVHVVCIRYNNSKFGQKVRIISHPHPLKYVCEASVKSPCHGCGKEADIHYCLECETCNFHLCKACVEKIEPLSLTR